MLAGNAKTSANRIYKRKSTEECRFYNGNKHKYSDENLKALCQRCHNQYDAEHRKQTRKGNSAEKQ